MEPEVEKKRRELYEAWATNTFYAGLDTPASTWNEQRGIYEDAAHWMAWCAFNAALDAVEIELPEEILPVNVDDMDDRPLMNAAAVQACITATGLGLRIK